MHRIKLITLVIFTLLFASCTAAQTTKTLDTAVASVGLIAKIATAYGSPYGALIQSFASAVTPVVTAVAQQSSSQIPSPAYGQNPTPPPPVYGQDSMLPPPVYGQDSMLPPPVYGQDSMPPPPVYGRDSMPPPPAYGQNPTPPPPAYGQDSMPPPPPAYGQDSMPPPPVYGQAPTPPSATYQGATQGVGNVTGAADSLTAEVDVVREGIEGQQSIAIPVRDGDVLTAADNYKVQISCNTDCYAYVAQLDSTGKMDPILPASMIAIQNPLKGRRLYSIPEGNNWFYLDNNKGVEQIYFIISQTPRPDIEQIFQQLSVANQNLKQYAAITVEAPMMLTRGISGIRQGQQQTVQFQNGQQGQYISTVLDSIDSDLVVTRWFNHQ